MTIEVPGSNNRLTARPEVLLHIIRVTHKEDIPGADTEEEAKSILRSLDEKNIIKIIKEEALWV